MSSPEGDFRETIHSLGDTFGKEYSITATSVNKLKRLAARLKKPQLIDSEYLLNPKPEDVLTLEHGSGPILGKTSLKAIQKAIREHDRKTKPESKKKKKSPR